MGIIVRTLALALGLGVASAAASIARAGDVVPTPPHLGQPPLAAALAHYRALSEAGGWPMIDAGPALRRGDTGERVAALRARLARERYLPAATGAGGAGEFDAALEAAVRAFQRQHGLDEDGIVGRMTLGALNLPVAARVRQIELNLARLRALPTLGNPYVAVNIAAQQLAVVRGNSVPLVSRVVVGKPSTPPPVLSSRIEKVIFNPPWNVPASIALNEILPQLRVDAAHLLQQNMVIVDRPADPHGLAIDWSSTPVAGLAAKLRQLPGPDNALGQIKFEFPNPYTVYLHDTPAKRLFERSRRAFSHGCMRVEKARDLAAWLLQDQGWGQPEIELAIARGATQEMPLRQPVALWVLYLTAFAGASGTVQFREDVYDWDRAPEQPGTGAVVASGRLPRGCE